MTEYVLIHSSFASSPKNVFLGIDTKIHVSFPRKSCFPFQTRVPNPAKDGRGDLSVILFFCLNPFLLIVFQTKVLWQNCCTLDIFQVLFYTYYHHSSKAQFSNQYTTLCQKTWPLWGLGTTVSASIYRL